MKKECAIVQDLLVLYEDDVLKEESREMVEEHIRGCEDCMQVYENASKELPRIEEVPEPSEKEKEEAADQVMKKAARKITGKTVGALLLAVLIVSIAVVLGNNICDRITETFWGLSGVFTLSTKDVSVKDLYVLKNGDLYCRMESEKGIGISQVADWVTPEGKMLESTDDAVKEIRFRGQMPWEWEPANPGFKQNFFIFTLSRTGVNEEGTEIIQNCKEISFYGKTKKDKLMIWEKGQKVKEAPEEIDIEAVRMYIENGEYVKALWECKEMGWKDYEKIFETAGIRAGGRIYMEDVAFEEGGTSVVKW